MPAANLSQVHDIYEAPDFDIEPPPKWLHLRSNERTTSKGGIVMANGKAAPGERSFLVIAVGEEVTRYKVGDSVVVGGHDKKWVQLEGYKLDCLAHEDCIVGKIVKRRKEAEPHLFPKR